MNYDSYQWFADGKIMGNTRSIILTTNKLPLNTKTNIKLAVTFRGYEFKDSLDVTLTKTSVAIPVPSLTKGLYLIRINMGEQTIIRKVSI